MRRMRASKRVETISVSIDAVKGFPRGTRELGEMMLLREQGLAGDRVRERCHVSPLDDLPSFPVCVSGTAEASEIEASEIAASYKFLVTVLMPAALK